MVLIADGRENFYDEETWNAMQRHPEFYPELSQDGAGRAEVHISFTQLAVMLIFAVLILLFWKTDVGYVVLGMFLMWLLEEFT